MKGKACVCAIIVVLSVVSLYVVWAHEHTGDSESHDIVRSEPGENPWNQGRPPEDWWAEIERIHGHVGPWNILGWRVGQAALREFDTVWGMHELDIVCHLPLSTPYTCLADGVVIGTGNSLGRLDIRLAETLSAKRICVSVRRKDGDGGVLVFHPHREYMQSITDQPVEKLHELSTKCRDMKDSELFRIERLPV